MPGVMQLIEAAIERGATYESQGASKATKRDLTHYVMEITTEAELAEHPSEWYKDGVITGALFAIWADGEF